jgi:TetR/AcrR family transcriptional repressor of nem operon
MHERRVRGRPRAFVETEALDTAMGLFWRMGYEGASMDALTAAMGISRSSLYQSFGDKETLFLRAVEHYARTRLAPLLGALDGGRDFRTDLAAFLEAVVRHATGDPERLGCLVACVLSDAAGSDARLRAELAVRFAAVEARIAARVQRAQSDGEVVRDADPTAIAAVIGAIARGMMLSGRAGISADTLRATGGAAVAIVATGLVT